MVFSFLLTFFPQCIFNYYQVHRLGSSNDLHCYCRNYYPKTLTTRRRITDRLANSQFQSLYNSLSLYFSLYVSLSHYLSSITPRRPFILLQDRPAPPASPLRSLRPTPTHVRWAFFLHTHTYTHTRSHSPIPTLPLRLSNTP